jgi:dihydroorotase
MPGVEWLLPLMADRVARGMCTWPDLVRWMCEGPARCYGIVGKGKIEPGYDGDLVLVDPRATRTIRDGEVWTKCGWSPFDGWTTTGWPVMTVIDGQPVFRDGGIVDGVRGRALTYQR